MNEIIISLDKSYSTILLNNQYITIHHTSEYEKFILYRDLIIYISLISLDLPNGRSIYLANKKQIGYCMEILKDNLISLRIPAGLGYGYAGIGYMLDILKDLDSNYLKLYNEINVAILRYLDELVKVDFDIIFSKNDNSLALILDYFKGIVGILNYMDIVGVTTYKLKNLVIKILKSLHQIETYNPIGIAHGYSAILLYIINTNILSTNEKKELVYMMQNSIFQILVDQPVYTINDLSWGNGKFGSVYALILAKSLISIPYDYEKKQLYKLCNLKENVYKKNVCSGISGCLKMLTNLYNKKLIKKNEFNYLKRLIEENYKEIEIANDVSVKEISIINGILSNDLCDKLKYKYKKKYYELFMI